MTAPAIGDAPTPYAARLTVDYPERLDRLTTLLRAIWILPIAVIWSLVAGSGDGGRTGGALFGGLWLAIVLMIAVRLVYPRWWFDFAREVTRFGARVGAYFALLTDSLPSTVDEQSVHLEIDYPDVRHDLNRWLPMVKCLLAIPHYVVLAFLWIGVVVAVIAVVISRTPKYGVVHYPSEWMGQVVSLLAFAALGWYLMRVAAKGRKG